MTKKTGKKTPKLSVTRVTTEGEAVLQVALESDTYLSLQVLTGFIRLSSNRPWDEPSVLSVLINQYMEQHIRDELVDLLQKMGEDTSRASSSSVPSSVPSSMTH